MTSISVKLTIVEVCIGVLILVYEFFTGQPWTADGVPWTMEENFHLNIAISCFVAAGFTLIFGSVIESIIRKRYSNK